MLKSVKAKAGPKKGPKPLPAGAANAKQQKAGTKKGAKAPAKGEAGKAAPKKASSAQTQSQLEAVLCGSSADAKAAAAHDAKPGAAGKRGGAADPLLRHGYATQGPIAAGAFSTIVRAKRISSGLEVAVKSFDNAKCKKDYQHLYLREGELNALRAAKREQPSRWIANLVEEHIGPNHTYAILEYCAGGSLQRHLQKLQAKGTRGDPLTMAEPEVRRLGAQVNAALRHLHRLDVAHRDLKPGNVLFYGTEVNHLKLCDFGFAKRCRGQRLHTICGTPIYMAPELCVESKKGYVGPPVDMWAFGALVYEMLHNRVAFNGNSEIQLHQRIRSGKHATFGKGVSKPMRAMIAALLETDSAARLTAEDAQKQKVWAQEV